MFPADTWSTGGVCPENSPEIQRQDATLRSILQHQTSAGPRPIVDFIMTLTDQFRN